MVGNNEYRNEFTRGDVSWCRRVGRLCGDRLRWRREEDGQRAAEINGSSWSVHLDLLFFDKEDDAVSFQGEPAPAVHAIANQGCLQHDRIRRDGRSCGNVIAKCFTDLVCRVVQHAFNASVLGRGTIHIRCIGWGPFLIYLFFGVAKPFWIGAALTQLSRFGFRW